MPEAAVAATARRLTTDAVGRLAAARVENPELDAQLLLAHAAGLTRERLLMDYDRMVGGDVTERFDELVARRAEREPVAYIIGRKDFRHITLAVDRRVLIPRPETELLVEVGLGLPSGSRVVDVGTGSGAVALALKHERPDLSVTGSDVSEDALAVARENARRLGLEVAFVRGDLLEGVAGPFDAVLANLPYVEDGTEVAPEIARYEPASALYAGADGLDVVRRLVAMVEGVPLVALEVGLGQAAAVERLLRDAGFGSIERLTDLAGHERVVLARA